MMPTSGFQERHNRVWEGIIFQNKTWTLIASSLGLNPALIGRGVPAIYHGTDGSETPQVYIVLVTGDKSGAIRFYSKVFLDSLRPHTFCRVASEVVFKDSNITLNIHDVLEAPEIIRMEPERLFSYQEDRLCSAYIFLHDSRYALRTLGPESITGIGGKALVLNDVSIICGLVLNPSEASELQKTQQVFCVKGLRGKYVRQIGQTGQAGHAYNGDICLGWKWVAKGKRVAKGRPRPLSQIIEEL